MACLHSPQSSEISGDPSSVYKTTKISARKTHREMGDVGDAPRLGDMFQYQISTQRKHEAPRVRFDTPVTGEHGSTIDR